MLEKCHVINFVIRHKGGNRVCVHKFRTFDGFAPMPSGAASSSSDTISASIAVIGLISGSSAKADENPAGFSLGGANGELSATGAAAAPPEAGTMGAI